MCYYGSFGHPSRHFSPPSLPERMMVCSKALVASPDSPDAARALNEANKAVSNAIHNLLNSLPGQKDVDSAIKEVARASIMITDNQFPPIKVVDQYFHQKLSKLNHLN